MFYISDLIDSNVLGCERSKVSSSRFLEKAFNTLDGSTGQSLNHHIPDYKVMLCTAA